MGFGWRMKAHATACNEPQASGFLSKREAQAFPSAPSARDYLAPPLRPGYAHRHIAVENLGFDYSPRSLLRR